MSDRGFVAALRLVPKVARDLVELAPILVDMKYRLGRERLEWEVIFGDLDRWDEIVCLAEDMTIRTGRETTRSEWVRAFLNLGRMGATADEVLRIRPEHYEGFMSPGEWVDEVFKATMWLGQGSEPADE